MAKRVARSAAETVGLLGSSLTQRALPVGRKPRCLLNPVAIARCTAVTASSRSRARYPAAAADSVADAQAVAVDSGAAAVAVPADSAAALAAAVVTATAAVPAAVAAAASGAATSAALMAAGVAADAAAGTTATASAAAARAVAGNSIPFGLSTKAGGNPGLCSCIPSSFVYRIDNRGGSIDNALGGP